MSFSKSNCAGEPGGVSPQPFQPYSPGADAQWHSLCNSLILSGTALAAGSLRGNTTPFTGG